MSPVRSGTGADDDPSSRRRPFHSPSRSHVQPPPLPVPRSATALRKRPRTDVRSVWSPASSESRLNRPAFSFDQFSVLADKRRIRHGQNEDALVRAYRLLELIGQARLFDHGLDSANLDRVRLFFVGGPRGFLRAARQELLDASKAWWGGWRVRLADRRCCPISVSLGVVALVLARFVEVPVRIEVAAGS